MDLLLRWIDGKGINQPRAQEAPMSVPDLISVASQNPAKNIISTQLNQDLDCWVTRKVGFIWFGFLLLTSFH